MYTPKHPYNRSEVAAGTVALGLKPDLHTGVENLPIEVLLRRMLVGFPPDAVVGLCQVHQAIQARPIPFEFSVLEVEPARLMAIPAGSMQTDATTDQKIEMRTRLIAYGSSILLFTFAADDVSGQAVDTLLSQVEAADPDVRVAGFYGLLGGPVPDAGPATIRLLESRPAERERITAALIDLLRMENPRLRRHPQEMTEAEGAYYGDLIWAVGSLEDPRAVDALIPALGTGRLAAEGLAKLGDSAVPAVLHELKTSSHRRVRSGATQSLAIMAQRALDLSLDEDALSRIRAALLSATHDDDGHVRAMAVRALLHFSDPEVRGRMETLS